MIIRTKFPPAWFLPNFKSLKSFYHLCDFLRCVFHVNIDLIFHWFRSDWNYFLSFFLRIYWIFFHLLCQVKVIINLILAEVLHQIFPTIRKLFYIKWIFKFFEIFINAASASVKFSNGESFELLNFRSKMLVSLGYKLKDFIPTFDNFRLRKSLFNKMLKFSYTKQFVFHM